MWNVDVLIVGGGLSGLSAAWRIARQNRYSLIVAEASGQVGGRTLNHMLPSGKQVDRGGTWVGPTQTALLALAKEAGVAVKNGKPTGKTFYRFRGVWNKVEFPSDTAPNEAQKDFERAMSAFETLVASVPTETPWLTPNAVELDRMTLATWIDRNTRHEDSRAWFTGCVRKLQGGDPAKTSLLWMLHFIATATFRDLLDTAEDFRFVGGSQAISNSIAARLGGSVWLNAPVSAIDQHDPRSVRVTTARGAVRAKQVIVATMPAMLRRIDFKPALPAAHRKLIAEWDTMSWVKFHAIYPKPFWRGRGAGSQFLCLERLVEAFDISPDDESWGEIVGFLLPDSLGRFAPEREAYCRAFLREAYGEGAQNPAEFTIFDWHEQPWIGGCVSSPGPGLLTEVSEALREPVGRIHWAGTERSPVWLNYMEGAVQAGQAAASSAIAALHLK
jgi:monoamine oxidase